MLATMATSSASKRAVRVEREPRRGGDGAALRARHELLRALGLPAHRPAELARRPQQQDPFGIEEVLHAEAAADIGRVQLDALGRQLEDELGELAADAVHPLPGQLEVERCRSPHRSARCRRAARSAPRRRGCSSPRPRRRARRRCIACATAAASPLLGHGRRGCRAPVPERRRAVRQRGAAVDDRRQRLVVDLDLLGGFARLLARSRRRRRRPDRRHGARARAPARGAAARSAASPPPGRASGRGRPRSAAV